MSTIGHHRAPRPTSGGGESGETLIELMATVVLLGVSIVALVGSLIGVMRLSAKERQVARAGNESVNVVENLRSQEYVPCATVSTYDLEAPPRGFTYAIERVEWLAPDTSPADPNPSPTWRASTNPCTATPGLATSDTGVQKITVRVTAEGPGAVKRRLTLVKRDRTCLLDPTGPKVC